MIARKRTLRVAVVLAVALASASTVADAAPVLIDFAELPFATDPLAHERSAEISGDLVVYTYTALAAPSQSEVAVRELTTGMTGSIGASDAFRDENADVSLGRVVYQTDRAGNWDVYVWDWRNRHGGPVWNTLADETEPRIDGNLLIARNEATGALRWVDLSRYVGGAVPDASGVNRYDVDNGRIVWTDHTAGHDRVRYWRPDGLGAGTIYHTSPGASVDWLRVHGDTVAFAVFDASGSRTYVYNLASGVLQNLPPHAVSHDEFEPVVFNRRFAWVSRPEGNGNILFRELPPSTLSEEVATSSQNEHAPSMFGRRVVYSREEPASADLWYAVGSWKDMRRLAGTDRYATAAAASAAYFAHARNAVLCTGEDFPDALAAAPLARVMKGPLLLTRPDTLPTATRTELARLGVEHVTIVGGTSAVSADLQTALSTLYDVSRIPGADRYETAANVARAIHEALPPTHDPERVFVVRGDTFADALAAGPVAACAYEPVLLVRPDSVPASTARTIDELGYTGARIIGGATAVSESTLARVRSLVDANGGPAELVERWCGADRYETATSVVERALANRWVDMDTLGVATGANFPDALGGGGALGCYGSPLVLTRPTSIPGCLVRFLERHEYEIGRLDVFGGPAVVSDDVAGTIGSRIK
jgi:putative cell wall-binding protein